jgi:hypothetical protein
MRTARNLETMVNEASNLPVTESEEQARLRVWERVRLGIAADHRRRIRQAMLAGMAGAFITGIVLLLVLL